MRPFSCLPRTDSRVSGKESDRLADRHQARRFRDMLEALPDPLAENAVPLVPPTPLTLLGPMGGEGPGLSSTRPIAPADGYVGAAPAVPTVVDGQTLTLRASTGPLAGLFIQAEWRNQRLTLRLSAPEGPLADRLARQQRQLQTMLSSALGVDVVVDVRHAH